MEKALVASVEDNKRLPRSIFPIFKDGVFYYPKIHFSYFNIFKILKNNFKDLYFKIFKNKDFIYLKINKSFPEVTSYAKARSSCLNYQPTVSDQKQKMIIS